MAKKLHGFTSPERAKQIAINRRVTGGKGTQAPRARRRRGKVVNSTAVIAYEFRNCSDPLRTLFLDNAEIAEHESGEVAVVEIDGVFDCWRLIGPAQFCKTGACAIIMAWGANCDACSVCFYLTPCGGGSPTFVRGVEWYEYESRVVKLDGPGHEGCYEVAVADGCFSVNEELTTEHVVADYNDCDGCGCYELTNCADEEDIIWVASDLATFLSEPNGAACIGRFIKKDGVCYEITAFANPCGVESPQDWGNLGNCGFDNRLPGCPQHIESCNGCCWMLTPCPDQEGDPTVKYYRLSSGDGDLTEFVDENGQSNGRVLLLADDICYTVDIPEACPEEDVILGLPTIKEEYDSCEDCKVTCWKECDVDNWIRTYSDMSEVGPGAVAKRAEDGKCYFRVDPPTEDCDGEVVEFTIEMVIDEALLSCDICQAPRVKLTPSCGSGCSDCSGSSGGGSGSGSPTMVTDNEALFPHVGQYVKIDGECYLVEWTTDAFTDPLGCWVGPFDSCAKCGQSPTRKRVVTDVYFDGSGNLMVDYADLEGTFNVCGSGSNDIASTEECEE